MRAILASLVFAGFFQAWAQAEPDWFLEGGALIAHYTPELVFSVDPPGEGWCAAYGPYAITTWEEQNNRVDVVDSVPIVWFVLAAWTEEKDWCGCEFGLGQYDPAIFSFLHHGPCFPQHGLEIRTEGWPGPGEGTALVSTGLHWLGNLAPVYYFTGYAYAAGGPGVLVLAADPATAFAGFSNCEVPAVSWEAASLGGLGINTAGYLASPVPPRERACCLGESCLLATSPECDSLQGWWLEDHDACDPNPCAHAPQGACCISGGCGCTSEESCLLVGGAWQGAGTTCCPNPCPAVCCLSTGCRIALRDECEALLGVWHPEWTACDPTPCPGVCCLGDLCSVTTEEFCLGGGGAWHPEWLACDPNPCGAPNPVRDASWGRMKSLYR